MTARPNHRRALLLMLVSALAFTATVLLVRWLGGLGHGNIWLTTATRGVVGLGLVLALYRRDFQPRHLYQNRRLIERGLLGGASIYLTYLAVVKLGAGRATFINNTYPVWGALMAAWYLREKLRPAVVTGGLAALLGIGLLTNALSGELHPGVYDLAAFVSALLAGWIVVTIRQLHHTEHTSTIFAAQCTYGFLLCIGPGVFTYHPMPVSAWLLMIAAGLAAGVGQLTMTHAFRDLPVAEGSLLQMLVPLGTAVGGMAFFGEHFTTHEAAGAALILGGTAYTAIRAATRANAEAE
jgi:drug/metabolite transporter (DMT)-like permease